MFLVVFAFLIGIYSYSLFFLGVFHVLNRESIAITSFIFVAIIALAFIKSKHKFKFNLEKNHIKLSFTFLVLIILAAFINLLGALSPELSFDALWYHLTLPKLYIEKNAIEFISGGLLYYSAMPKLIEMVYIPALLFGNEISAKLIHFSFGILTLVALYKLSRIVLPQKWSLLVILLFYSNLVVAWESTTAYIDLGRTFYEVMAVWTLVLFYKEKKRKWLVLSASMIGFAITAKLLALASLVIFILLLLFSQKNILFELVENLSTTLRFARRITKKQNLKLTDFIKEASLFTIISLIVPLPWLVFSYISTGNPIYPFFTDIYPVVASANLLHPLTFVNDFIKIFLFSDDPLSPIYLIALPVIFVQFTFFTKETKLLVFYSLLALLVWYITPRTGGGRFIMPYLPVLSIIVVYAIAKSNSSYIKNLLITIILLIAVITIGYRALAVEKYVPYLLGRQTKDEFLSQNLNYSFGDFYDVDGYFKRALKSSDKVLIYDIHNLYYVNFPFIHESYVKKGDTFNYTLVKDSIVPKRFEDAMLIYSNDKTGIKLYTKRKGLWKY